MRTIFLVTNAVVISRSFCSTGLGSAVPLYASFHYCLTKVAQHAHISECICGMQEPEPMPPGKGRRNMEATPGPPDSVSHAS